MCAAKHNEQQGIELHLNGDLTSRLTVYMGKQMLLSIKLSDRNMPTGFQPK